jgi:hypothetical protein
MSRVFTIFRPPYRFADAFLGSLPTTGLLLFSMWLHLPFQASSFQLVFAALLFYLGCCTLMLCLAFCTKRDFERNQLAVSTQWMINCLMMALLLCFCTDMDASIRLPVCIPMGLYCLFCGAVSFRVYLSVGPLELERLQRAQEQQQSELATVTVLEPTFLLSVINL